MAEKHYSISDVAKMSGLSLRTLRYYDQIGLLCPSRSENDYRVYGESELKKLQQILLLRSCELPLADIAASIDAAEFDLASKLQEHLESLYSKLDTVSSAIERTKETLSGLEAFEDMNDEERFEELKRTSVSQFEGEYGQEARDLYGDDAIDAANERMLSMSKLAWDAKEELEQRIKEALVIAMETGSATSPESRMLAEMHAQWIRVHWGEGYTPEAHRSLVEGYMHDPRFVEYYDGSCGQGATLFLRDAVLANVG